MFKLGDIIKNQVFETEPPTYYIVSRLYGNSPEFEPLDDYIMRSFTVLYNNELCTLREILESEKQKIIKEYESRAQTN
jgi:hypothetical protein